MPLQVVNGAQLMCAFGSSPSSLSVLPINRTKVTQQPKATIQDHVPMLNIMPFGMCLSPSNPQVAAATARALAKGRRTLWVPWALGPAAAVMRMLPQFIWRRMPR